MEKEETGRRNKGTKRKGTERAKRIGRTRAKNPANLFARSSLLFCPLCCLHRPHHRQPLTLSSGHTLTRAGRGPPRPALVVIPLRHHRATAGNRDGRTSCPPRPPLPARLVCDEGRADHQPGQGIPSRSPCRPSPPCRGVRPNIPAKPAGRSQPQDT